MSENKDKRLRNILFISIKSGGGFQKLLEEIYLSKMTWPEVEERLKESDIAIIIVAATEEHGTHLPLETDIVEVCEITRRAAEKVADEVKPVIAPPIPYGVSMGLMSFPGTITVREETLRALLKDVCKSLIHHGFKKIVIMDGHGVNYRAIDSTAQEIAEETGAFITVVRWWELGADIIEKETEAHTIIHADEAETSIAWACGARVLMDKAKKVGYGKSPFKYEKYDLPISEMPKVHIFSTASRFRKESKTGATGDPTKATREKGEKIVNATVDRLADFLKELKAFKY
jgi:creatinine amidohydrolase